MAIITRLCNDYGDDPGCLGQADDAYTMDFTDIDEGYIYWCTKCGQRAHAQEVAINEAFDTRPGFAKEFEAAIEKAEQSQVKS